MPTPRTHKIGFLDPVDEVSKLPQQDEFVGRLGMHVALLRQNLQKEHEELMVQREGPLWAAVRKLQEENQDFRRQLDLPTRSSLKPNDGVLQICSIEKVQAVPMSRFAPATPPRTPKLCTGHRPVVPSRTATDETEPAAEREEDVIASKPFMNGNATAPQPMMNGETSPKLSSRKLVLEKMVRGGLPDFNGHMESDEDEYHIEEFKLWPEWLNEGHRTLADRVGSDASRTELVKQSCLEAEQLARAQSAMNSPAIYPGGVLGPTNNCLIGWHLCFMVVLTYDLLMIPMAAFELPETGPYPVFGFLCMLFWTCDLPLTLNVAYYTGKGKVKYKRRQILCNYAKGWLFPDFILVLIDWLEFTGVSQGSGGGGLLRGGKAVKAFRVLRVLRILRMRKLREVLVQFDEFVNSQYFTIVCSIVLNVAAMMILSHFLGCLWFTIGKVEVLGYPSWVKSYSFEDMDWEYQYLTSLHWCLTQFTPGSMPVQPQNIPERAYAVFVLIAGMIIFSSIVSSITAATNGLKSMNAKYNTQMTMFRRMCREQGINTELLARITRYAEKFIQPRMSKVNLEDIAMMHMLPKTFQMEVLLDVYGKHIIVHPMFALLKERSCLSTVCTYCLTDVWLDMNEFLFSPGDQATSMYFVREGFLSYTVFLGNPNGDAADDVESQILKEDMWFGEAVLWTPWVFQGSMAASTVSVLMAVNSKNFRENMMQHRVEMAMLRRYGRAFIQGMNELAGFFTDADDDDCNLSDVLSIPRAVTLVENIRAMKKSDTQIMKAVDAPAGSRNSVQFGVTNSIDSKASAESMSSQTQ